MIERPLAVGQFALRRGAGIRAHHLAVHAEHQQALEPLEAVGVPIAHRHRLRERALRIIPVAQVICPVGVHRVVSRVLVVDRLEDVYLAALGPTLARRLRHHPGGGEVTRMQVSAQAHLHPSVGERELAARLHGARDHRHIVGRAVGIGYGATHQAAILDVGHLGRAAYPTVPRRAIARAHAPLRCIGTAAVGLVELIGEDQLVVIGHGIGRHQQEHVNNNAAVGNYGVGRVHAPAGVAAVPVYLPPHHVEPFFGVGRNGEAHRLHGIQVIKLLPGTVVAAALERHAAEAHQLVVGRELSLRSGRLHIEAPVAVPVHIDIRLHPLTGKHHRRHHRLARMHGEELRRQVGIHDVAVRQRQRSMPQRYGREQAVGARASRRAVEVHGIALRRRHLLGDGHCRHQPRYYK